MNNDEKSHEPFKDLSLELIVGLLNKVEDNSDGRVTQPITLFVKGIIVSGIIITRKEYFRSHPILEHIDETFDKLESEGSIPKPEETGPIYYIHLKEARVFSAGHPPLPSNCGVYWRGRLDSVDGFSLGGLEERKAENSR